MTTVTCNIIDTRSNKPAAGMRLVLKCLEPKTDWGIFCAEASLEGKVDSWIGYNNPDIILCQFLDSIAAIPESYWQLGFLAGEYFGLDSSSYTIINLCFTLKQGRPPYHISLAAGPFQYTTYLTPWEVNLAPYKRYQRLSKHQKSELVQHFANERYPNKTRLTQISRNLKLRPVRVRRWFCTQRYKFPAADISQVYAPEASDSEYKLIYQKVHANVLSIQELLNDTSDVMVSSGENCAVSGNVESSQQKQPEMADTTAPIFSPRRTRGMSRKLATLHS